MEIMEVVVFICRTEKSQGIVTAQISCGFVPQETMRVQARELFTSGIYNGMYPELHEA